MKSNHLQGGIPKTELLYRLLRMDDDMPWGVYVPESFCLDGTDDDGAIRFIAVIGGLPWYLRVALWWQSWRA